MCVRLTPRAVCNHQANAGGAGSAVNPALTAVASDQYGTEAMYLGPWSVALRLDAAREGVVAELLAVAARGHDSARQGPDVVRG